MRIALIHIAQETNDFNPKPTTMEDFHAFGIMEGQEMIDRQANHGMVGGYLEALRDSEVEVETIPIVRGFAVAGGRLDRETFDFYIKTLNRLAPDAQWCAAGIGPGQIEVNEWCIAAGGHTRTGLEDNIKLDRTTLAPSNAALVQRAAALCGSYNRPVATPEQARKILGLRAV